MMWNLLIAQPVLEAPPVLAIPRLRPLASRTRVRALLRNAHESVAALCRAGVSSGCRGAPVRRQAPTRNTVFPARAFPGRAWERAAVNGTNVWGFILASIFVSLFSVRFAFAAPGDDFGIHVTDEATGRGVPLVQLRTVNDIALWTDSAGWIAFQEPGLMDREVYFAIESPAMSRRRMALEIVVCG